MLEPYLEIAVAGVVELDMEQLAVQEEILLTQEDAVV